MIPLDGYEHVRELGQGSFGTVWLVQRHTDRKLLALKTLHLPPLASREPRDLEMRRQALREVEALRALHSPYIVRYVDAMLIPPTATQVGSKLHLLTEHCDGGNLATYMHKFRPKHGFPEAQVWEFTIALLLGLQELHACKILHRDLKPANLFLKRVMPRARSACRGSGKGVAQRYGHVMPRSKLCARSKSCVASTREFAQLPACLAVSSGFLLLVGDLGLAREVTDSQPAASTMVGTPHYCAPEIFEGEPYGDKADIYSFGMCVYEMVHGRTLHADAANAAVLVRRMIQCEKDPEKPIEMDMRYSAELRSLVVACLSRSPTLRPTASELLSRLPAVYKMLRCYDGLATRMSRANGDEEQAEAAASWAEAEAEAEVAHETHCSPNGTAGCTTAKPDDTPLDQEAVNGLVDATVGVSIHLPCNVSFTSPSEISADQANASVQVCPSQVPPCRFFGGKSAFNFMPPHRGSGDCTPEPSSPINPSATAATARTEVATAKVEVGSVHVSATDAVLNGWSAASTCGPGGIAEVATIMGLVHHSSAMAFESTARKEGTKNVTAVLEPQKIPISAAQRVKAPVAQRTHARQGHIPVARGAHPMSYVCRSRECLARWRRERQELKSKQRHPGRPPASGGQLDCLRRPSTSPALLEVRGVALPLHVRSTP
mmetsp:Transcript_69047/g.133263  ORF Transcript_69047/g.133263 Transcript_69047/m.133263 type:complete len:661 (+) Transcript_69047:84-2066(+)